LFVLCLLDDVILQRLRAKGTRGAMLVVIQDGRYLAITAYMLLRRVSVNAISRQAREMIWHEGGWRKRGCNEPRDALNLGDFAWIQDSVRDAAEGGTDVERDDEPT
jgi:hypothetical protein